MTDPFYVYLCFGHGPNAYRELAYSLTTLLDEINGEASRVLIYTDRPERFEGNPCRIVDIGERLPAMMQSSRIRLHFRAKPATLALALRMTGQDCVLLDTDSFIRKGFDATVRRALENGAAMNSFVRRDAYPGFGPFETILPQIGPYRFDREKSVMLNSGLIGARREHAPILEDAVVLLDRLFEADLLRHDVEQFAVAEAFRTAGVSISLIDREFEHYCARWSKRYMRNKLRGTTSATMGARRIPYSKSRIRLFKFHAYWRLQAREFRRAAKVDWGRLSD